MENICNGHNLQTEPPALGFCSGFNGYEFPVDVGGLVSLETLFLPG